MPLDYDPRSSKLASKSTGDPTVALPANLPQQRRQWSIEEIVAEAGNDGMRVTDSVQPFSWLRELLEANPKLMSSLVDRLNDRHADWKVAGFETHALAATWKQFWQTFTTVASSNDLNRLKSLTEMFVSRRFGELQAQDSGGTRQLAMITNFVLANGEQQNQLGSYFASTTRPTARGDREKEALIAVLSQSYILARKIDVTAVCKALLEDEELSRQLATTYSTSPEGRRFQSLPPATQQWVFDGVARLVAVDDLNSAMALLEMVMYRTFKGWLSYLQDTYGHGVISAFIDKPEERGEMMERYKKSPPTVRRREE